MDNRKRSERQIEIDQQLATEIAGQCQGISGPCPHAIANTYRIGNNRAYEISERVAEQLTMAALSFFGPALGGPVSAWMR